MNKESRMRRNLLTNEENSEYLTSESVIQKSRESQFRLMWIKFRKHKVAVVSLIAIVVFYILAIFNRFFSPYEMEKINSDYVYAPPTKIYFVHEGKFSLRPFVYASDVVFNRDTFRWEHTENREKQYSIRLFVRGYEWKLFGLFPSRLHFFDVEEGGHLFLFGTEAMGRDLFSRILYGSLISLSIGWVGMIIGLFLGVLTGGLSGALGGKIDILIQRWNEILMSYPSLPLWIALAAVIPRHWNSMQVYFTISILLSLLGSGSISRAIRGKVLSLKNNDYVTASRALGANMGWLLAKDLIPGCWSYILVVGTLRIPGMILGESALSFLGLGIRPPMCSWGTLLEGAQKLQTLAHHPWMLLPGLFIVAAVLVFNFMGDGLRDMADPYAQK